MTPIQATTLDDLYLILDATESEGEVALVPIATVVQIMGLDRARQLIPVKTHEYVNRRRLKECLLLEKASQLGLNFVPSASGPVNNAVSNTQETSG